MLLIDRPYVYPQSWIPKILENILISLKYVMNNKNHPQKYSGILDFKSINSYPFTKFAKNYKFDTSLYHAIVAPHYNVALVTET